MELRPYQNTLIDDIDAQHDAGARNVLAVLPTGGGKTVTFSEIINRQTLPVCVNVHRIELVAQISMTLAAFGIRHRLVTPTATTRAIRNEHYEAFGRHFENPQSHVAVASVDTLLPRGSELEHYLNQVRLWLTDEAAHMLADNKWGKAAELMPNARGIGFTATPYRADGKGLGAHNDGVFHSMVRGPSTATLMAMGYLSGYRVIAKPSDIDLSQVNVTASGDYSPEKLRTQSHRSHIVGDVVEEYIKHGEGRQGITFTVDVETAVDVAERFNSRGVAAAAVSAKSSESDRRDAVKAFREGRLQQLTNCDLFGEGFDVPGAKVVSLARPTRSLALHLQQMGRVLRPVPGSPDELALIIDHVGNVVGMKDSPGLGLPDSPRTWSLEARPRSSKKLKDPNEVVLTTCLDCFMVFERKFLPVCPHCGSIREPTERGRPESVDGDLTELDPKALLALREKVEIDPADIARRVGHKAGAGAAQAAFLQAQERVKSQHALQDSIAVWAGLRKERGQNDKTSYREFFLAFGVDVLTAQTLPRVEMDDLRERIRVSLG